MLFLAAQGFDFNTWVREGVPFMQLAIRDKMLAAAKEERRQQVREPVGAGSRGSNRMAAAEKGGWHKADRDSRRVGALH